MTISAQAAERIYSTYSGFYDLLFNGVLQPGRERAMAALDPRPGDRVLEVGVGTGLSLPLYPPHCDVVGIDVSSAMLEKAEGRARDLGMRGASFLKMEAERMTFPDGTFDRILASYVMSTVADPEKVVEEIWRVCRPSGTVVILNHFLSRQRPLAACEAALTPLTRRLGFVLDLALDRLAGDGRFHVAGVEPVNFPPLWSVVRLVRTS